MNPFKYEYERKMLEQDNYQELVFNSYSPPCNSSSQEISNIVELESEFRGYRNLMSRSNQVKPVPKTNADTSCVFDRRKVFDNRAYKDNKDLRAFSYENFNRKPIPNFSDNNVIPVNGVKFNQLRIFDSRTSVKDIREKYIKTKRPS